jgi:hypothetical protein
MHAFRLTSNPSGVRSFRIAPAASREGHDYTSSICLRTPPQASKARNHGCGGWLAARAGRKDGGASGGGVGAYALAMPAM